MVPNVYEILNEFQTVQTRDDRKNVLLKYGYLEYFRKVLQYTFNPFYQFYTENEFPKDYVKPDTFPGIRLAGIESEIRKFYLFLKGDPTADKLTEQKRHVLLLQLLESFEPEEAVVWFNMMNKDLKIKGLTESLVRETFPELF